MNDGTVPRAGHWLAVRGELGSRRHRLARVAAGLYPGLGRVASTDLLGRDDWAVAEPLDLDEVTLNWVEEAGAPPVDGTGPVTGHLRAPGPGGRRPATYADTLAALAPPAAFEDRIAYRLLEAELAGGASRLTLGRGSYFDGVNVGEAAAHELAAAVRAGGPVSLERLPLRAAVGNPADLTRRPALLAVTTVTIRHERGSGEATFLLHWRDPARVAHGGGMYQVMPVGVFQPSSDSRAGLAGDFDLWRGMVREFSEELLGGDEDYGPVSPAGSAGRDFDYEGWPFYRDLSDARRSGAVRVYVLGLGVDPLTFATDLLAVAVIDSGCFDELFAGLVQANSEGTVVRDGGLAGLPFDADRVGAFRRGAAPMQAAGAAVLSLAHRHREVLLA